VMPLGSPIGSHQGITTRRQIEIIITQATVPVVVDAGIGAPSHAAEAFEMGADAVLVNTAIAVASDPVRMAQAFKMAVEAGRSAYEIGLGESAEAAAATSPLTTFLYQLRPGRGDSALHQVGESENTPNKRRLAARTFRMIIEAGHLAANSTPANENFACQTGVLGQTPRPYGKNMLARARQAQT
jgi:hypothetical protein